MLSIYRETSGPLRQSTAPDLPGEVIWMDLLDPTDEEKTFVESRAGVRVPSAADLSEVEVSSRLQVERGVLYLSTPVVAQSQTPDPILSAAGFILSERLLVTVRFTRLSTFDAVAERIRVDAELCSGIGVFTALMEAIVDRGADVLEHLGAELDRLSRAAFRGDPAKARRPVRSGDAMRLTLSRIGDIGDRLSLARDTLLGVGRITHFTLDIGAKWIAPEFQARLGAVGKDVASLNDYEAQLSNKVQFLLDAVLGFITIEQNDLFKVLTIVSVVGIPPTLVAGIYGMNFKTMPELNWAWGYPFGLAMIALSAILPLIWFKARGWF